MKKVLLTVLCLVLAGCASFDVTKSDESMKYHPTNPEEVKILEKAPEAKYTVIGEIRAEGETLAIKDSMKQRMREEAAQIGGQAIILEIKEVPYRVRDEGVLVDHTYGFNLNKAINKKMTGKIIRFDK